MTTDNTAEKQQNLRGKPFPKGVSGNPNGRPKGSLNFATVFENSLMKLSRGKKGDIDALEEQLVTVGLKKAMAGDYRYWNALMERRFGKVKDVKQIEVKEPERIIYTFSEKELADIEDGTIRLINNELVDIAEESNLLSSE